MNTQVRHVDPTTNLFALVTVAFNGGPKPNEKAHIKMAQEITRVIGDNVEALRGKIRVDFEYGNQMERFMQAFEAREKAVAAELAELDRVVKTVNVPYEVAGLAIQRDNKLAQMKLLSD